MNYITNIKSDSSFYSQLRTEVYETNLTPFLVPLHKHKSVLIIFQRCVDKELIEQLQSQISKLQSYIHVL